MGISDFLYRSFVRPLQTGEGYNMVNTFIYGILLLLLAFATVRALKRAGIELNRRFFFALVPFMLFAGVLRALEEFARVTGAGVLPHSYLFLTPGIYFLTAALALLCLLAARRAGEGWERRMQLGGALLLVPLLLIYLHDVYLVLTGSAGGRAALNPGAFAVILAAAAFFFLSSSAVLRLLRISSPENLLLMLGVALDSASVYVAYAMLGYAVEQPLTHALLGVHPLGYPLFKLGFYLLILHLAGGEESGDIWLVKLLLLVLALPMGVHNTLQILLGV